MVILINNKFLFCVSFLWQRKVIIMKNKKEKEVIEKRQRKIEKNLIKDSYLSVEQLFGKYDSSFEGLDDEEV